MIAYLLSIGTLICINGILAVTLNLIMGYAGIYSMAHGVLYGVSAYAAALIALHVVPSFELALVTAMMVTTVVSVMVAGPCGSRPRRVLRGRFAGAADGGHHGLHRVEDRHGRHRRPDRDSDAPTLLGFNVQSPTAFFVLSLAVWFW